MCFLRGNTISVQWRIAVVPYGRAAARIITWIIRKPKRPSISAQPFNHLCFVHIEGSIYSCILLDYYWEITNLLTHEQSGAEQVGERVVAKEAAREFVEWGICVFYGEMGAFFVVMVMCRISLTTFELVYDRKTAR